MSDVVDPIADALVSVISAIAGLSSPITGLLWDPGMEGIDAKLPVGIVGVPRIIRATAGAGESELGRADWRFEYPIALTFDLSDARKAQAQAVESAEALIKAIDANHTLGGIVFDTKVSDVEPFEVDDDHKPKLIYRCRVEVRKLVDVP